MATVTTDIMLLPYSGYYYGGNPGAAIGLGILGGALGGIRNRSPTCGIKFHRALHSREQANAPAMIEAPPPNCRRPAALMTAPHSEEQPVPGDRGRAFPLQGEAVALADKGDRMSDKASTSRSIGRPTASR